MRTPLNTAFIGLNILQSIINTPAKIKECFDVIRDVTASCDVALNMVNDMMLLDKMEDGKLILEKTPVAVWKAMKTAVMPFFTQVPIIISL